MSDNDYSTDDEEQFLSFKIAMDACGPVRQLVRESEGIEKEQWSSCRGRYHVDITIIGIKARQTRLKIERAIRMAGGVVFD